MAVARPMTFSAEREPLDKALKIGDRAGTTIIATLFLALFLHGTASARTLLNSPELFNWARAVENRVTINLTETIDIETEKPKPPPPPEPPPEEEKAKPFEPPIQKDVPPPPPPEAAQAGKVLTQDPDPNAPVDFTGDGFVSGNGESYVGGITQAGGKGTHPTYNPNGRATGVPNGTGAPTAAPAPVGPDRSRAASRAGSDEWHCDFPPEADAEQIDEAFVTLQVVVGADSRPKKVTVLQDPGHGFGRMAYQCAQRESYNASFNHDGTAIESETRPFRVHFVR
jgi:protein TonB